MEFVEFGAADAAVDLYLSHRRMERNAQDAALVAGGHCMGWRHVPVASVLGADAPALAPSRSLDLIAAVQSWQAVARWDGGREVVVTDDSHYACHAVHAFPSGSRGKNISD